MMGQIKTVTVQDVEAALVRVELGETTADDANLIRAYLAGLRLAAELAEDDGA